MSQPPIRPHERRFPNRRFLDHRETRRTCDWKSPLVSWEPIPGIQDIKAGML